MRNFEIFRQADQQLPRWPAPQVSEANNLRHSDNQRCRRFIDEVFVFGWPQVCGKLTNLASGSQSNKTVGFSFVPWSGTTIPARYQPNNNLARYP